jgi:protein TonB
MNLMFQYLKDLIFPGKQRISVQFVVDQVGNIVDVQVRAPHKRLEKEAKRVIELLPQMTPGQQQKNAVRVKYNLPIVFEIQD